MSAASDSVFDGPMPMLRTERLLLRPFQHEDAGFVQEMAGDRRVAMTTANIPHPYPDGAASVWIVQHEPAWSSGNSLILALTEAETSQLLGAVSIGFDQQRHAGELGYWIGVPHWGNGFATEAARAIVDYAFRAVGAARVYARHAGCNAASGRVLEKLGIPIPSRTRSEATRKVGFPLAVTVPTR